MLHERLVVRVLVMLLSLSFVALAEQNFLPSTTSEVGTTQDLDAVRLQAISRC